MKQVKKGLCIYFHLHSLEKQSIRTFDDEKKCRYLLILLFVHFWNTDCTKKLNCFDISTEGCHLELKYHYHHYFHRWEELHLAKWKKTRRMQNKNRILRRYVKWDRVCKLSQKKIACHFGPHMLQMAKSNKYRQWQLCNTLHLRRPRRCALLRSSVEKIQLRARRRK